MDDFYLKKETHEYFFRGRVIPGVSEILRAVGLVETQHYTEEGREFGSFLHQCVYMDLFGALDVESIPEEYQGRLKAWEKFKRDVSFEPHIELCERAMMHKTLLYAGTPDLVCELNQKTSLIDLKMGGVERWAGYQTAAYENLLGQEGVKIKRRYVLKLGDGDYKLIPFFDGDDHQVFLSALNVYRAQKNSKKFG